MRLVALALPALLWAIPAEARFAPPEDRPLRFLITDERGDSTASMITRSERRAVFHRTSDGYTVELTIVSVDMSGSSAVAAMAGIFMKTLTGQTIRYHLDAEGKVVAIEGQPALIANVAAALRGMGATGEGDAATRGRVAARIADSIAAAPEPAQRAMLASMLTAMIVADRTEAPAGEHDVSVPASALGKAMTLPGRETVLRRADRVTITTRAEGDVAGVTSAVPGTGVAAPGAQRMRVVERQDIDPATGLLVSGERTSESWLDGAPARRSIVQTTMAVLPVL